MDNPKSCDHDQTPAQHRLAGTMVWLLRQASLHSHRLTQQRLSSAGVNRWQHAVLAVLVEFGPATQAEICRRIDVDRSDMVAILNDLQERDYISRKQDPTDRRRNIVTLTRAGRAALRRFDRLVIDADVTVLAGFSDEERAQLINLLERIVKAGEPA